MQPSVHVRRERNGNQLCACYNNGDAEGLVLLKKFGARKDRKDDGRMFWVITIGKHEWWEASGFPQRQ